MFNYETEPVMRLSRLMVDADEEAASQSRSLVTNTLKHHQDIVDNQRQRQAANEELRIQRQIQAAEEAAEEEERQRNEEEKAVEEDRNRRLRLYRYRPPSASATKPPSPPRRDSSPFSEPPKERGPRKGVTFVEGRNASVIEIERPASPEAFAPRGSTSSVSDAPRGSLAPRPSTEFNARIDTAFGGDNDRRRKSMFAFLPTGMKSQPDKVKDKARNTSAIPITLVTVHETIALRELYEKCTEEGIGYAASVAANEPLGSTFSMPATPVNRAPTSAPNAVTGSSASIFRPLMFDVFHVSTMLHTANVCAVPPGPEISRIIAKVRLCHLGHGEVSSSHGPAFSTNVIGGRGPVVDDKDNTLHTEGTTTNEPILTGTPTLSFQMLLEVVQLSKEWTKKVDGAIDACSDAYINITTNRSAIEEGRAFSAGTLDDDDSSGSDAGDGLPLDGGPDSERREAEEMRRRDQNRKLIRVKDVEKVLRTVNVGYDFDTLFHGVDTHYDGKHITPKLFRWLAGTEDPAIVKSFVALGGEETLSGTIPVDVVISKCAAMNMTPQFIANFVAVADANDDGVVDYNEFLAMVIRNRIETKGSENATTRTWSLPNLRRDVKGSAMIKRVGSGLKDSDETWTDEERAAVENNLLDFFNLTGASISADATATKTMDMADINKPDGPQIRVSPSFSPPPQDMRTDAPTEGRLVSPLHDRRGSDQSATGSDAPFPRRARFSIQPDGGLGEAPRRQSTTARVVPPAPEVGDIFEEDVFVDPDQAYAATAAANVLASIQQTYFDDEDLESEGASSAGGQQSSDEFIDKDSVPFNDGLSQKDDRRHSSSASHARLLKMEAKRVRNDEPSGSTSAMLHDVNIAAAAVFGNDARSLSNAEQSRRTGSVTAARVPGGRVGIQAAKMADRATELVAAQRAKCRTALDRLTKQRQPPIIATSEGPFKVRDTCIAARDRGKMKLEHRPKKRMPATCPRLFALNLQTIEDLEAAVQQEQEALSGRRESPVLTRPRPVSAPRPKSVTSSGYGRATPIKTVGVEDCPVEPVSALVRDKQSAPPSKVPKPPVKKKAVQQDVDDGELVDSDLEEAHAVHIEKHAPRRPTAPFPQRPPSAVRPASATVSSRPPSGSPRARLDQNTLKGIRERGRQIESHFKKVGASTATARPQSAKHVYAVSRPPSTIPSMAAVDSPRDQRPMFSTSPKHRHTRTDSTTATITTRNALNRIVASHLSYRLPVADAAFLRANGTIQRAIEEVQKIVHVDDKVAKRPMSNTRPQSNTRRPQTSMELTDEAYYDIREDDA